MKWRYPQLSFRPKWFGWKEAKPLAKFSSAVFLSHIAGLLANDTDKVIAGIFLGPTAVAIYQVGYKLYDLARTLFAAPAGVLMPTASRLAAQGDHEKLRQLLCQVSSVMIGILASIYFPLIFYGKDFIRLWVGHEFEQSALVLMWLSIAMLAWAHDWVQGTILWGTGRYQTPLKVYFLYATVNASLSILLCLKLGVVGIAMATTVTATLSQIVLTSYTVKQFGLNLKDYIGRAWIGAFIGGVIGWLMGDLAKVMFPQLSFWRLLLQGLAFEIGFWFSMTLIGLTPQTREQLRRTFRLGALFG